MTFYDYVLASEAWARKRERLLCERGRRCERCGRPQTDCELQLHHKTYERLGCERDDDLEILCLACHAIADQERADATRAAMWSARVDGWARRRYGDEWNDDRSFDVVEDAFKEWLDR